MFREGISKTKAKIITQRFTAEFFIFNSDNSGFLNTKTNPSDLRVH